MSANTAVTPATNPVSWANSRNMPTPACDTTPTPSALTLTRRNPLLPFTREVPSREDHYRPRQSVVSLTGQALRASQGGIYITPMKHLG